MVSFRLAVVIDGFADLVSREFVERVIGGED
jgi:hypothetical protein